MREPESEMWTIFSGNLFIEHNIDEKAVGTSDRDMNRIILVYVVFTASVVKKTLGDV